MVVLDLQFTVNTLLLGLHPQSQVLLTINPRLPYIICYTYVFHVCSRGCNPVLGSYMIAIAVHGWNPSWRRRNYVHIWSYKVPGSSVRSSPLLGCMWIHRYGCNPASVVSFPVYGSEALLIQTCMFSLPLCVHMYGRYSFLEGQCRWSVSEHELNRLSTWWRPAALEPHTPLFGVECMYVHTGSVRLWNLRTTLWQPLCSITKVLV